MIKCSNCSKEIRNDYKFCPYCGTQVVESGNKKVVYSDKIVICNICGEDTENSKGFCQSCGAKLSGNEKISTAQVDVLKTASKVKLAQPVFDKKKPESIKRKKLSLTGTQIFFSVAAVLVIGFLILEFSGAFEKENEIQQNPNEQSTIQLQEINEINNLEVNVKSDTTNIVKVLELAHRLNDAGFFQRATEYYKMYINQNPNNADVLVDLGVCYFELKLYNEAKSWMKRGLKINPAHQIAHFNLGIVNLSAGNLDSAKYWWNKAIVLNPSSEIGKKAKELLESH